MNRPDMSFQFQSPHAVSHAGWRDTLAVLGDVVVPTLWKGPLIRRRSVVARAERQGLDDRAVRRLQKLRAKYGPGPLVLPIPFRRQAVLLSAEDAHEVLNRSPEPFAAATSAKRAALAHFEPDVALASHGMDRAIRRRLNEQTLETECPMHSRAAHFARIVDEEMQDISAQALDEGALDWDTFFRGWYRMVRRIVLGDEARHDTQVTSLLKDLRYRGNFVVLRPKHKRKRAEFLSRVKAYVDRPDPDSLAGQMAAHCTDPAQKPHHQLPQYLFAFDPGGMAVFRTLALLATHPREDEQARAEIAQARGQQAPPLDFLQACYRESLRLWPTTPAILRETTVPVHWAQGTLPKHTQVLIFAPFFHRDDETLEQAHTFDPGLWLGHVSRPELALLPFSHGPVICPATRFVPMIGAFALRSLLSTMHLRLHAARRMPPERLPGTLDNYTLTFSATPADAGHGRETITSTIASANTTPKERTR
jgi:cytochrome P450